jgi:hypothetical protein
MTNVPETIVTITALATLLGFCGDGQNRHDPKNLVGKRCTVTLSNGRLDVGAWEYIPSRKVYVCNRFKEPTR